jgi:hypothetical protein
MEKSVSSPKHTPMEDLGRGSGCSSSAPNLQMSTAKTIYRSFTGRSQAKSSLRENLWLTLIFSMSEGPTNLVWITIVFE